MIRVTWDKNCSIALLIIISAISLGACSSSDEQDLRTWMGAQGVSARGKVPPIEPLKIFTASTYSAQGLPDPFKPQSLALIKTVRGPDLSRRKETLEAYPLETLTMVGTLYQMGRKHGLVRTAENKVHQVVVGQYLGQNYGRIDAITDTKISIHELVQDGSGDWAERQSALILQERETNK